MVSSSRKHQEVKRKWGGAFGKICTILSLKVGIDLSDGDILAAPLATFLRLLQAVRNK